MADTYLSNKDGHRINPTFANSDDGETQKVILVAGVGQGADQECLSCLVKPDPNNSQVVRVNLKNAADTNDGPLDSTWTPMPVSNTNLLHFSSTDEDAIVYIIWRN